MNAAGAQGDERGRWGLYSGLDVSQVVRITTALARELVVAGACINHRLRFSHCMIEISYPAFERVAGAGALQARNAFLVSMRTHLTRLGVEQRRTMSNIQSGRGRKCS